MLEKPKEAISYLEKALHKFEESGNYDGQTSVANNLGELNMQIGDSKKHYTIIVILGNYILKPVIQTI